MQSILILVMFGMLLLQPGASSAETSAECQTRCSTEMASGNTNCPPPGDEGRSQCFKDNLVAFKSCIDSCPKDAPTDTPKDVPADPPKEQY
jgi:hypothetical protein